MRNLSRTLALTAALLLTALTTTVSAQTFGSCQVRCLGAFPIQTYTVSTTKADCCSGNYPNYCPPGTTPVASSWNSMRCAF